MKILEFIFDGKQVVVIGFFKWGIILPQVKRLNKPAKLIRFR